jgi:hypothetical protein
MEFLKENMSVKIAETLIQIYLSHHSAMELPRHFKVLYHQSSTRFYGGQERSCRGKK